MQAVERMACTGVSASTERSGKSFNARRISTMPRGTKVSHGFSTCFGSTMA